MSCNLFKRSIFPFFYLLFFVSCGDDSSSSSQNSETIENKTISGVVQFGPFEKGATIAVYELDEKFQKTGINYENEIENEKGEYSINVKELKSRYALLKANGYFHSYITDKKSIDKIALYALADLGDHSEVNINILTHLSHKRAIYLATEKKLPLADAGKQAEKEVLKSFDIDEIFDSTENWNIFGNKDKNAALLALSILMQSVFLKGNIDKILDDIVLDFEKDGIWDDKKTKNLIADFAYKTFEETRFSAINENIKKLHSSTDIPPFEKYINNFWWQNYGLGSCEGKRKNEVKKNQNSGSDYSKKLFICRPEIWRGASEEEIFNNYWPDTLDKVKGKDGDIYQSKIDSSVCYVYEGTSWRKGKLNNCTLGIKGCTKQLLGYIKKSSDSTWYICNGQEWISQYDCNSIHPAHSMWDSIKFEKDTLNWKDTIEGAIRKGNKTGTIYVFDNNVWRIANQAEASLGGCTEKNQDSTGYVKMREGQNYINKYRSWINSSCKFLFLEGYYKCNGRYWEESDECTFEISKWKKAKEGDARLEKKCDNACYVFETGKWRTGDATECILGLGGCTAERNGTIEKGPSIEKHKDCDNNGNCKDVATIVDSTTIKHYVCHSLDYSASWKGQGHWDIATEIEIDAYPAVCSSKTFGRIFPINNKYYICDKGTYGNYNFRESTTDELTQICSSYNYGKYKQLDGSKAYLKCDVVDSNATVLLYDWTLANEKNTGTMTDPRDNSIYKTIILENHVWMAENLNYSDSVNYPSMRERSWCYNNKLDNCKKYGRLYYWSAAIDSIYWSKQGETCGNLSECKFPKKVQGICPEGWHLPSISEFNELIAWLKNDGAKFKASGFITNYSGFYNISKKGFGGIGEENYFLSSAPSYNIPINSGKSTKIRVMRNDNNGNLLTSEFISYGFSVRCVKDDD